MIDDSDGDFVLLSYGSTTGLVALILFALAITLYVMASINEDECGKRTCSAGLSARLVDHECLCTEISK
jgi:hypothetical protein